MKQNIILLLVMNLLTLASCNGQESTSIRESNSANTSESSGFSTSDKFSLKNLKKSFTTKVDGNSVNLAICAVDTENQQYSSLTYYFINPKTNKRISKFQSVLSVKGCEYSIPAFVIKDINNDGKDDFIFLELYNDNCSGNFWIKANFKQIKPTTTRDELDYYLKLRNDVRINRKVQNIDPKLLQKKLTEVVSEIFSTN